MKSTGSFRSSFDLLSFIPFQRLHDMTQVTIDGNKANAIMNAFLDEVVKRMILSTSTDHENDQQMTKKNSENGIYPTTNK